METDESSRVLPFQLQFDKPVASQVSFHVPNMLAYNSPSTPNIFLISTWLIDKNCGMESREGSAGHGYRGLKDFAASF